MKKKLVLSLAAVMLFAMLTTAALAVGLRYGTGPIHSCYGTNRGPLTVFVDTSDEGCTWGCNASSSCLYDVWTGRLRFVPHTGDSCEYCGWIKSAKTETKTVSSTTAVVKTTTGQRLIIRDKASFSGKVIGYLKRGTQVCVQSDHGKFALILCECGGKTVSGFVWKKDLHNMETITYSYEVNTRRIIAICPGCGEPIYSDESWGLRAGDEVPIHSRCVLLPV